MDPYLQGLVEARKSALACLKSALDNVGHMSQIVNSLNIQIASVYSGSGSANGEFSPEAANNSGSTSNGSSSLIAGNQFSAIGNELCRAAMLLQKSVAEGHSSARTFGFQGRSKLLDLTGDERVPEESGDKARREPDTQPAKDPFTVVHVKPEPIDVVDVDKTDSTNLSSCDTEDSDPLSLDERLQMLAEKQRDESSPRKSTRLQPMVRLEVLQNEELTFECSAKRKAGRPRKRKNSDESDELSDFDDVILEKRRSGSKRKRKEGKRKLVVRTREEVWPSRIQPKRPTRSTNRPITVVIKDEDEDEDAAEM